jgi:Putative Zn-dependent protease, contains TPR repeats
VNRIETLTEVLSQDPTNAFARYGLAIEYSNSGQMKQAIEEFEKLLSAHPDYTAGYFMAAQTMAKSGRQDEAVKMLREGITVAAKKGDTHAQSEMQAMLDEMV